MLDTPELDRRSQQLDYPRKDSLPILVGQVSSALAYIRQENARLKQQTMQQNRKLRHAALRLSAAQAENAAMRENIRGLMLRNARLQKLCAARKKMATVQEA